MFPSTACASRGGRLVSGFQPSAPVAGDSPRFQTLLGSGPHCCPEFNFGAGRWLRSQSAWPGYRKLFYCLLWLLLTSGPWVTKSLSHPSPQFQTQSLYSKSCRSQKSKSGQVLSLACRFLGMLVPDRISAPSQAVTFSRAGTTDGHFPAAQDIVSS